jgi:DNA-directed RNA polymerase specialized sigma24 family protein
MSFMRMEKQIQKFYRKWSPGVLAFCCLLLGEGSDAERSTVEAFQAYLSRGLELEFVQLPTLLFLFALEAAKRSAAATPIASSAVSRLQDGVALLPWNERAVFSLRGVMALDDMTISEIVEIPIREVRRIWMSSVFRLRELLSRDFSPERTK